MTTDPFTEAARDAVEKRHPAWHDQGVGIVQGSHYRAGFVAGAAWARDHLAEQEPSDAVRELHHEVIVYELDSANGTWAYGKDDERVVIARFCAECSDDGVIDAVEDCEWMEGWHGREVPYPCATIQALDSDRTARRDEEKRDG